MGLPYKRTLSHIFARTLILTSPVWIYAMCYIAGYTITYVFPALKLGAAITFPGSLLIYFGFGVVALLMLFSFFAFIYLFFDNSEFIKKQSGDIKRKIKDDREELKQKKQIEKQAGELSEIQSSGDLSLYHE